MTIEATLDRIAVALERLADTHAPVARSEASQPDAADKTAAEKAAAKMAKAVAKAAAEAKAAAAAKAAATPKDEDDFLGDGEKNEEEVVVSKDTVRAALAKYGALTDNKTARALMKEIGGSDKLGEVPDTKYHTLLAAANKAIAAVPAK